MSFQIDLKPNRKAAARYVGKVRRKLVEALGENPNVSRSQIADALGVHRSVITRQLNGRADLSLGRVAEIAWSLGYEADFDLKKKDWGEGSNHDYDDAPVPIVNVTSVSSANPSKPREYNVLFDHEVIDA
ncbi:MAG: helix-turn-helix transcriptional regulator [Pseudomonadota bacterium]|nr:helix-turn-helix transcriptional regulator [Pseudomonadota bacterium]